MMEEHLKVGDKVMLYGRRLGIIVGTAMGKTELKYLVKVYAYPNPDKIYWPGELHRDFDAFHHRVGARFLKKPEQRDILKRLGQLELEKQDMVNELVRLNKITQHEMDYIQELMAGDERCKADPWNWPVIMLGYLKAIRE